MPRPTHLSLALMLATFAAAPAALAQAYPTKPVTIVVGYPAGGSTDLTGRTLGDALAKQLGVPVVIENLGGAGGAIGAQKVASAAPDGHTLLLISSGTAVSQALFKSLPFDTLKAFTPVAPLATFEGVTA